MPQAACGKRLNGIKKIPKISIKMQTGGNRIQAHTHTHTHRQALTHTLTMMDKIELNIFRGIVYFPLKCSCKIVVVARTNKTKKRRKKAKEF